MTSTSNTPVNMSRWSEAELRRVARAYELLIKIDQRTKRKLAVKTDKKERKIKG